MRGGLVTTSRTLLALGALSLAPSAGAQSIASAVNSAIDRGAVRLLELQSPDGSWSRSGYQGAYPMGATAFTAYTLRKSGLPKSHPAIKKALSYLSGKRPQKTYCAAAMILFLDSLGGSEHKREIHRLGDWLEEATDPSTYLWAYPAGQVDLSNSQFAALGLWAAANHEYEAGAHTWLRIIDSLLSRQNADGGFGYRGDYHPESSGGMTSAGITMLSLAVRELNRVGNHPSQARAKIGIEEAWKWFDQNFTATGNPAWSTGWIRDRGPEGVGSHMYHYYYLYGLERVAALSEREQIGGRDWYQEGAIDLLKNQNLEGGWGSIEDTCFALLFLRRATFSYLNKREYTLAAGHRPVDWSYSTQAPQGGWQKEHQEAWAKGKPLFRDKGEGTSWTTRDLWLTREFDWEGPAPLLRMFALVDDQATFWLNGIELDRVETYTNGKYRELEIPAAARAALKPRKNVLAAHVINTGGAGAFDLRMDPLGIPVQWDGRLVEAAHRAQRAFWKVRPTYGVPWMRRWLVLGPVPDKKGTLLNDAGRLPDDLDNARAGSKRLSSTWREVNSLDGRVDLEGRGPSDGVWWATTWLHAPEGADAALWLGSQRPARIVLDGEVLVAHNLSGGDDEARLVAPLSLTPGSHRLMLKFSGKGDGAKAFSAKLADRSGRPLPSVTASLSPDGPELSFRALLEGQNLPIAEVAADLPRSGSRVTFQRASDTETLALGPSDRSFPVWGDRSENVGGPVDARGVLALRPPSASTPARAVVKLKHAPGRKRLEVRAAAAPGNNGRVRLRILALEGTELREVLSRELRGEEQWTQLEAPLLEGVRDEHVFVLEASVVGGHDPRLFLDDLELR